jgi:sn-glycerol 3-phosphate transport system ATP-binding protein
MADVVLRDVRKTYPGGVAAIRGVSLGIGDGQFCVLVGPSGCGKSTLLRMVAGLETVTAGEIVIGGRVVTDMEPADRDIAMVFQSYALYPHMSVYDNMAYGLRNRRMARADIDARVRAAAATLEIEALLARKPKQLSGGQRQRVAMGRAIVRQPKVFLFDEPLSNLDAKLRIAMRLEIGRLQRRLSTTALYVTHDQLEAMTLADMLVVMNGGAIEQIGHPLAVYQAPATTFVASFIGAPPMNLAPLSAAAAAAFAGDHAAVADGAILGVRPEDLTVDSEATPAGGVALELGVEAVELVGPEVFVHGCRIGAGAGGPGLVVRIPGQTAPVPGDTLRLVAPRAKLHLFSADGRRRITIL